jgi:hypothetical protein
MDNSTIYVHPGPGALEIGDQKCRAATAAVSFPQVPDILPDFAKIERGVEKHPAQTLVPAQPGFDCIFFFFNNLCISLLL